MKKIIMIAGLCSACANLFAGPGSSGAPADVCSNDLGWLTKIKSEVIASEMILMTQHNDLDALKHMFDDLQTTLATIVARTQEHCSEDLAHLRRRIEGLLIKLLQLQYDVLNENTNRFMDRHPLDGQGDVAQLQIADLERLDHLYTAARELFDTVEQNHARLPGLDALLIRADQLNRYVDHLFHVVAQVCLRAHIGFVEVQLNYYDVMLQQLMIAPEWLQVMLQALWVVHCIIATDLQYGRLAQLAPDLVPLAAGLLGRLDGLAAQIMRTPVPLHMAAPTMPFPTVVMTPQTAMALPRVAL